MKFRNRVQTLRIRIGRSIERVSFVCPSFPRTDSDWQRQHRWRTFERAGDRKRVKTLLCVSFLFGWFIRACLESLGSKVDSSAWLNGLYSGKHVDRYAFSLFMIQKLMEESASETGKGMQPVRIRPASGLKGSFRERPACKKERCRTAAIKEGRGLQPCSKKQADRKYTS